MEIHGTDTERYISNKNNITKVGRTDIVGEVADPEKLTDLLETLGDNAAKFCDMLRLTSCSKKDGEVTLLGEIGDNLEQKKTFTELFKKGKVTLEQIHDYIENWHNSDSNKELHEYLGLTEEQYRKFFMNEESLNGLLK